MVSVFIYNDFTMGKTSRVEVSRNSVRYEMDQWGNQTKLIYPDATFVTKTYDALNRLQTITDTTGTTTYSYHNVDRKIVETRPNGDIKTSITEWGKVTSLISTRYDAMLDANVSVFEQSLTYDEAGNVTHEVRKQNDVITTIDNQYNSRGELTQSSQETGLNKVVYQYTMSPFGNKSENIDYYANGEFVLRESKAYVYNHLNQLESSNIDGITVEYDYDDYGNLVEESNGTYTKTYAYDLNNRLIEVIEGSQTLQFSYDGSGNRLSKSINATEVNYVNDTSIENEQVLSYKVETDVTNLTYGLTRLNEDGSGYLSDSYGNIVQHGSESYAYTPYGELTQGSIDGVNEAGYKGEMHDCSSLQYLRARTYNSELKQFLQEDTNVGKDTHPLSQNRYAFVLNNPFKYSDPSGHIALPYEKEDKGYSGNYKPLKTISKTNSKGTTNVPKAVIHKKLEQLYTDEIKQTKTTQQVKLEHTQQILAKNEENLSRMSESSRKVVEEQIKNREILKEASKSNLGYKAKEIQDKLETRQTEERNKISQTGAVASMIGFGAMLGISAIASLPSVMMIGGLIITAGAALPILATIGLVASVIGIAAGVTLFNTGTRGTDLEGKNLTNREANIRKNIGSEMALTNVVNGAAFSSSLMLYNESKQTSSTSIGNQTKNQTSQTDQIDELNNQTKSDGDLSSPSEIAKSWQGKGNYPGVDEYEDIIIKKDNIIYRGEPKGTDYFTTKAAIEESGYSATNLFKGLQVRKSLEFGYRSEMQGYISTIDINAAYGKAIANSQNGVGGLPQIFVPNSNELIQSGHLLPVDSIQLKQ